MKTAYLILQDGTVFEGKSFGAKGDVTGEIVFTTGMTGYLETITDPSYYGQIILQTFPLIGNYGVIPDDFEKSSVAAKAYIVKYPCQEPSNFRSIESLDAYFNKCGIIGLCDIDTRALTKIIRENGVMNGKIMTAEPTEADRAEAEAYLVRDAVASVSSNEPSNEASHSGLDQSLRSKILESPNPNCKRVALMDFGAKKSIAEALIARGCEIWTFPYNATAQEIMQIKPDGIMLSNGPGDPADPANEGIVEVIKELMNNNIPIFGICLGHQLLALANGYKTKKLKFGHRGANQPVKDMRTGRVYISSQNHGYAVVADDSSFINVNDGTCEGMDYGVSFSVQFHPEACGGPLDTAFLFDIFIKRMNS